ncbi:hypothetical protein Tco_1184056 [Tanacetum coccineum]
MRYNTIITSLKALDEGYSSKNYAKKKSSDEEVLRASGSEYEEYAKARNPRRYWFEGIIDFPNASSIKYVLTVNPTVYESCIKQLWATAKAKAVNGERQIQSLVDKKKVIITEKSLQVFPDKQVEGMSKHKGIYVTPSHTKKIFANMKREGKVFSGRITPLFQTMMVQASEDMGEESAAPTDSYSTPIITQPSSSKPQKKKSRRKQRNDSGPTEPIPDEVTNEEPVEY